MTIADAIQLIKTPDISDGEPAIWADLGCGNGTFTLALANLLPPSSTIYAIDQSQQRIQAANSLDVDITFQRADFVKEELDLPELDGILMANAIHYVKDKKSFLQKMEKHLSGSAQFLIVEYDSMRSNSWVPYPIDFQQLTILFQDLGYSNIQKLGEQPSLYRSGGMYGAFIRR